MLRSLHVASSSRVHRQREVVITRSSEEACPKVSYVLKLDVTNAGFLPDDSAYDGCVN